MQCDQTIKLPYKIALLCVLLPLATVHITLITAMSIGNLEPCIPYYSNCHSISATGRQYPEFFIFKGLMIPTAMFMMAYWLLLHTWIKKIDNVKPGIIRPMGLIAATMLIVYTVTLGAVGEPYALARRIGVVFYFGFTSGAHLLLLTILHGMNLKKLNITNEYRVMCCVCAIMISTAVASAIAGAIWENWHNWDNAYEWWFSILMISLFYMVARMWHKTQFTISFKTIS
jgi:hypothetical protein